MSGLDAFAYGGTPYRAHYEFKTSSSKNPKPSRDNREQVVRQRVNIARNLALSYEYLPPSVIFIIGKTGHFSSYVYGPFHIQPSIEEYEAAEHDIDITSLVFRDCKEGDSDPRSDPRSHPLMKSLQRSGCYECFPRPVSEGSEDLKRLLDEQYHSIIGDYLEATEWYESIQQQVKALVEPGQETETDLYSVHRYRNGALKIKPKV